MHSSPNSTGRRSSSGTLPSRSLPAQLHNCPIGFSQCSTRPAGRTRGRSRLHSPLRSVRLRVGSNKCAYLYSSRHSQITLRTVSYPHIWNHLLNSGVSHYCGAPTVQVSLCKRLSPCYPAVPFPERSIGPSYPHDVIPPSHCMMPSPRPRAAWTFSWLHDVCGIAATETCSHILTTCSLCHRVCFVQLPLQLLTLVPLRLA